MNGHVFEIMTCDRFNLNPINILTGKRAVLTKSPTAKRDDILIKKGNQIIGRIQCKDTPKGIYDTVRRSSCGQYAGTRLIGTVETKKAYDKVVGEMAKRGKIINKKMSTNGISSVQTNLIAKKALGGNVIQCASTIMTQAKRNGLSAGKFAFAIEGVKGIYNVSRGKQTPAKAVKQFGKEVIIGSCSSTISDGAATAMTIGLAATPAAPVAVPAGIATGIAVGNGTDFALRKSWEFVESGFISANRKHEVARTTKHKRANQ